MVPTVGNYDATAGSKRFHFALQMVHPIGRKQQAEGVLIDVLGFADRMTAGEHLANQFTNRAIAGFAGEVRSPAARD